MAWLTRLTGSAHKLCCEIRRRDVQPFAGIPFVGISDFRQVSAVVSGAGVSATLWTKINVFSLATPIRSMADPQDTAFVDAIGENFTNEPIPLPLLRNTYDLKHTVDFLYPTDILLHSHATLQRAFFSVHNSSVDKFNEMILDKIANDRVTYFCADTIREYPTTCEYNRNHLPTPEFLGMLTHPGVPPHQLDLKVRVEVIALHRRFVKVRLLNNNEIDCIPRITFTFIFNPPLCSWSVERKQFPLRLAYACTLRSVLDLTIPPFAHGQLYTALARVRPREDWLVLFEPTNGDRVTYNVVHAQLLL